MRNLLSLFSFVCIFTCSQLYANSKSSDKRTYISGLRYMQNGPSQEQADPLYVTVNVKFSRHIKTVGDAIKYIIARSGYHISNSNESDKGTRLLMSLPLPQVQRRLEPMTLRQALRVLIGEAYAIEINPISRSISFGVKPKFKKMLSAAIADFYSRRERIASRENKYKSKSKVRRKIKKRKTEKGILKKSKSRTLPTKKTKRQRLAKKRVNEVKIINPIEPFAKKIKSKKISLNQAIVAIFESNREKFHNQNMYLLKAHAQLSIPLADVLARYKEDEADYIVLSHFHTVRKIYLNRNKHYRRLANKKTE